jgi:hypothetical protein
VRCCFAALVFRTIILVRDDLDSGLRQNDVRGTRRAID